MTPDPERYPPRLRRRLHLYRAKVCPRCRRVYGPRVQLARVGVKLEPLITYERRVWCSWRCNCLRTSLPTETDERIRRALSELGRLAS